MGYTTDNSLQTMDYAALIWRTNMAIMESTVYGNTQAIPSLIDFLETILFPYQDAKYKTEVKKINDLKPITANTPAGIKANLAILNDQKVMLTHRALLDLAYRKKFLPATGSHQSDNYVLGASNE